MRGQRAAVAGLLSIGLLATAAWSKTPAGGEAIYQEGVLNSGASLVATRESGTAFSGQAAACVNCHRHSGLGMVEGSVSIPPVAGTYLFQPRVLGSGEAALTYLSNARANRDPYSDATLARAIREGVDSEGHALTVLMPRYRLGDADMASLIAYLKELDPQPVPGVTDTTLHFASIITPESDPTARAGMLDVLTHYFAEKNTFPFPPTPKMRSSGKTLYAKSMYMANRHWQLHIWELKGPPASWEAQLEHDLDSEPVLAAVSGLGGAHWAPVHEFCQRKRLPCLFPNVEVPIIDERDFYPLYFSKGVLLEASLIADRIAGGTGEVTQIYRAGDSGEAAAQALSRALKGRDLKIQNRPLPRAASGALIRETIARAPHGVLVLWLRGADLAALQGLPPPASSQIFTSGILGGMENSPLPQEWRGAIRMAYPQDLPALSQVRVRVPLQWFQIKGIPIVAESVQVNTYLACGFLAETVSHMADTIGRDYLVERLEEMMEHRLMTGPYPRLTLAAGQRFASKGGYVVRFADAEGPQLRADGDWIVP